MIWGRWNGWAGSTVLWWMITRLVVKIAFRKEKLHDVCSNKVMHLLKLFLIAWGHSEILGVEKEELLTTCKTFISSKLHFMWIEERGVGERVMTFVGGKIKLWSIGKPSSFFFFFFWPCPWHMETPGLELNLSHSCNQSHNSDNTRSLTP